jgi:hypothetical protein
MSGSPAPVVDCPLSFVSNCDSDVYIVLNASRVENTFFVVLRPDRVDSSEVPSRDRDARRGSRRFSMSRDIIVDDILTKLCQRAYIQGS